MNAELLQKLHALEQADEAAADHFDSLCPQSQAELLNACNLVLAPEMLGPAVMCNTMAKRIMAFAIIGINHATYILESRKAEPS